VTITPEQREPLDLRCRVHGIVDVVDADEPYAPRQCPVLDAQGRPCSLPLFLATARKG
jgi:hypothetical protein